MKIRRKHTARKPEPAHKPTPIASVVSGFPIIKNIGLRHIHVADTMICDIDGAHGRLTYRGYPIETLADNSNFEETVFLLLNGRMPVREELESTVLTLKKERWLPTSPSASLSRLQADDQPMDILQGYVALLAGYDPELNVQNRESTIRKAVRLVSKMSSAVALWARIREGKNVVPPREDLSHAANFLYMLTGEEPDPIKAQVLDTTLILQAEHQFNASTFACRVVASTRAHIYACVSAGIGALSGPLHGGAANDVIKMLKEIETADRAEKWVKEHLDSGNRVSGFGHAVYRTYDPRARILKALAHRLAERSSDKRLFELSDRVEEVAIREFAKRGKAQIFPNVDFYSAVVNTALDIPDDLYACVFAMSRAAGWCAHIIEEKFADAQPKPALYRPMAHYVGPGHGAKGLPYIPIDERKAD